MANTTNYNWETPDDTDLVKDGAAAIRTLGSSVDTTTKALNPSTTLGDIEYRSSTANTNPRLAIGTTGQILSVVAGVPSWVANDVGDITEVQAGTGISVASGTGPVPVITNTVATAIDAKGDLIGGTGADTFSRLAVGANDTVLTADSTAATGLKWAAPAGGGGFTELASGSLSGTSTVVSITTTGYKQLVIYVKDITASADYFPTMRLNGDAGNNYTLFSQYMTSSTGVATNTQTNAEEFYSQQFEATAADNFQVWTVYDPANSTTYKNCNFYLAGRDVANTFMQSEFGYGQWRNTAAITSITFTPLGGVSYSTGTYEIYGVK
jgi:hypothetical protein